MTNADEERSAAAHSVLDRAVVAMRELGFEGPAPWRVMAWNSFEAIRTESDPADAAADLKRLRDMLDTHLAELGAPAT